MNPLHKAVDDYLKLRRGLGFKLREYGVCLRDWSSFWKARDHPELRPNWRWNLRRDVRTKSQSHGHGD